MNVLPNLYIVGAPKSGTTSLHNYLAQHPQICMSDPKEPGFWATDFQSPLFYRQPEQYAQCFSNYKGERLIGESSSCYLYSQHAARNIASRVPDAKIVVMLRNPIAMVPALHAQYLKMGIENIADLGRALAAEKDRARGDALPPRFPFPKEFLLYRRVASYPSQIETIQRNFDASQLLVILFEDFVNQTSMAFRTVCKFLGASSDFKPTLGKHNPTLVPRSVRLQRLAHRLCLLELPSVLGRSPRASQVLERAKPRVYKAISRINLAKPKSLLTPHIRQNLVEYFERDFDRLETLLGYSLDIWRNRK